MQGDIVILMTPDVAAMKCVEYQWKRLDDCGFHVVIRQLVLIWVVCVVNVALDSLEEALAVAEPCEISVNQRVVQIALQLVNES